MSKHDNSESIKQQSKLQQMIKQAKIYNVKLSQEDHNYLVKKGYGESDHPLHTAISNKDERAANILLRIHNSNDADELSDFLNAQSRSNLAEKNIPNGSDETKNNYSYPRESYELLSKLQQMIEQAKIYNVKLTEEEYNYLIKKGYEQSNHPLHTAISNRDELATNILFRIHNSNDADELSDFLNAQLRLHSFLNAQSRLHSAEKDIPNGSDETKNNYSYSRESYELLIKQKYENWHEKLYSAILHEDSTAVALFSKTCDVNKKVHGFTMLQHAFRVKTKSESTGSIDRTPYSNSTIVLKSEQVEYNPEIVILLAKAGANFLYCDSKSVNTLLHTYANFPEIVKFLLGFMPVDVENYDKKTPLFYCQNSKSVEILVKAGADTNKVYGNGEPMLHEYILLGDVQLINIALKHKADVNKTRISDGNTPLHYAIKHNKYEICKKLIEAGALVNSLNFAGETPLDLWLNITSLDVISCTLKCYSAASYISPAKLLIDAGAKVTDSSKIKLLDFTAKYPHSNIFDEFKILDDSQTNYSLQIPRKHNISINKAIEHNEILMYKAIGSNDLTQIKELIAKGILSTKNSWLYEAISLKKLEIAELLIRSGADINESNYFKTTNLQYAAEKNYYDLVILMIQKGAVLDESMLTDYHFTRNPDIKNLIETLINMAIKHNESGEVSYMGDISEEVI